MVHGDHTPTIRNQIANSNAMLNAVVKFSGLAKETDIIECTQQLKQFMQEQKLVAVGSETLARYDPPWTLWFLRRNELMIKFL